MLLVVVVGGGWWSTIFWKAFISNIFRVSLIPNRLMTCELCVKFGRLGTDKNATLWTACLSWYLWMWTHALQVISWHSVKKLDTLIPAKKIAGFRADSTEAWKLSSKFWPIFWNRGSLLFLFEAQLGLYFKLSEHKWRWYYKLSFPGRQSRVCGHTGQLIWGRGGYASDHSAWCQLHHLRRIEHWRHIHSELVIAFSCH